MQNKQIHEVESTNKGGAPIGNQNAAKAKQLSAMLEAALYKNDKQSLRDGVDKIVTAFSEGEVWAANFVFDRIEGKVAQRVEGPGEGGEFITKMVVELVEANGSKG